MDHKLQLIFFIYAFAMNAKKMIQNRKGLAKAYKKGKLFYQTICAGFSLTFISFVLAYGAVPKYEILAYLSISALIVGEAVYVAQLAIKAFLKGDRLALTFLALAIGGIAKVAESCWQCQDLLDGLKASECLTKLLVGMMYIFFYLCDEIIKIALTHMPPKPKTEIQNSLTSEKTQ